MQTNKQHVALPDMHPPLQRTWTWVGRGYRWEPGPVQAKAFLGKQEGITAEGRDWGDTEWGGEAPICVDQKEFSEPQIGEKDFTGRGTVQALQLYEEVVWSTRMAQWLSIDLGGRGSILGQGTFPGCELNPNGGVCRGQAINNSLLSQMFPSLFSSLSLPEINNNVFF